ncbi:hypothetical protein HY256_05600 [Candidatus Sumerlaeota bacterium]|nr:hypothetical protein [Candidatus Sumerlaeota bacterium]
MKTILYIADGAEFIPVEEFAPAANVGLANFRTLSFSAEAREDIERALPGADAVLMHRTALSGAQIESAQQCAVIVHAGAGAAGLDLEIARSRGIYVTSVPDFATEEYAELTGRLIRDAVPQISERVRHRPLRLGIAGLGQVGRAVARLASEIGLDVWGHDPFIQPEIFRALKVRPAQLDELLGICDVITLHLPAEEGTRGLIGGEAFGLMKIGAALINVSSSEIVDHAAAKDASAAGRLAIAALLIAEGSVGSAGGRDQADSPDCGARGSTLKMLTLTGSDSAIRAFAPPWLNHAARRRALCSGYQLIERYFAGATPGHLLIDPALPRQASGG